jgi:glycine/D-amino acid oxidase-like deaminating enzyme
VATTELPPAPSFWLDSTPGTLQPRTALTTEIEADVAIIGAGYTGLWTAYYLKKSNPSLNIVMLESHYAGFGASGRNGGWCSAYLSGIEHWLDDPEQREGGILLQKQMFDTVAEIGRIASQESIDCHFEQSGALEVAVIPAQMERLEQELEHLQRLGFSESDYQRLGPGELQNRLKVEGALGAIHMKHCAAIQPALLARGLAEVVERLGVTLYEQSPVLQVDDRTLVTASGKIKAGAVVVATEGYSGSISGRQRRLVPIHSMMVVTEPLSDGQIDAIGFDQRYCFGNLDWLVTYGQLTADRRIAFGCRGTYHYGSHLRTFNPDDPEFRLVRQTLLRFFPSLEGISFTHSWGGCMGVSRSLRPSVNFDSEQRFGWAGGYFGNGVGASHLAGRTMADLVSGQSTERTETPWVNPTDAQRRWEPEPLRWLGVKSRARLMHWADRAEYLGSPAAPLITRTLDTLFP